LSSGRKHIVIVGGGIIGSCAAYHLLQAGAKVILIEAATRGGATSGAGAGFVSHWSAGMIPMGEAGYQCQDYGIDFYRCLAERAGEEGHDIGFRPNGSLMLALTEQGRETFVRPVLESPFAPRQMQDLDRAEIAALALGLIEPTQVHSAAYNPHGIQFDTTLGLQFLVQEIIRVGGEYHEQTRLIDIEERGNSVLLTTDKGQIEADGVVLAAGAWNGTIVKLLGWHLPMLKVLATRVTTQVLNLPSTIPTVQCRELRLWLRETFGALMWGTGGHYYPFHRLDEPWIEPGQPHIKRLMQKMVDEDQSRLEQVFPPLRGAQVAAWAQGVPCYTPDRNLLLGVVPGTRHIVLAGGDNETGVTHGPALGRLASEILLERPTMVDITNFRLERFAQAAFLTEADVEAAMPSWTAAGDKEFLEHKHV